MPKLVSPLHIYIYIYIYIYIAVLIACLGLKFFVQDRAANDSSYNPILGVDIELGLGLFTETGL
jgi:hypothetical protein